MRTDYKSILFVLVIFLLSVSFLPVIVNSQDQSEYTGTKGCAVCHPNQKKLYDLHDHSKLQGGVEKGEGIGCETCHGPGQAHVGIGAQELQKLKKEKGDLKILASKDNSKSEMCRECHTRSDNDNINLTSNNLIIGLQQYSELARSKKATMKMTCTMCHDPHGTSKEQAAMKRKCLDCHKGEKWGKPVKIKAMSKLACESCHMPYAVSGDNDTQVQDYQKGSSRSHIFGISVDSDYSLNNGTRHAALTKDGFARMTVEMTCYSCHKAGISHDMSREEMLSMAEKVH